MKFIILIDRTETEVKGTSAEAIAKTRIQLAMDEEGDATIKDYLNDFTEVLADIASENGDLEDVSRDPKDYVDHIASHLLYSSNAFIFAEINGVTKQVNPKDVDTVEDAILKILKAEL